MGAVADKAKGLSKKLKFDSHHAIERFGVMFVSLCLAGAFLFVSAGISAFSNNRQQMDSTALYVSQFMTSRTQLQGEVPGVFVSPDRTRALVMMAFRDPESISSSAQSYQAYLTGATTDLRQEALKTGIDGQIVVFGSTGYIGMVLESDEPFEQQILNLTMRANAELVYAPGDSNIRKDLRDDNSFQAYDQWRIYVNPGASEAKTVESLGGTSFDPGQVYYDLVVAPREAEVRTELDEQLGVMQADLSRINEFEDALGRTATLDGDFLVNPRMPTPQEPLVPIAGDEVVGDQAHAEDGQEAPSTMELETGWVAPNGFDFDWRSGSVGEGYLDQIVPEGQRYGQWLTEKAQAGQGGDADDRVRFRSSDIEWTLTNGDLLDDRSGSTQGMQDVMTLRTNLSTAYDTYWTSKQRYQVELPMQLLEMEIELRGVEQSFSTHDGQGSLYIY